VKSKVDYIKIQGHPSLIKDLSTGAILNINNDAIVQARMKKSREKEKEKELIELKNDVSEIKKMLIELSKKMVEQNG
jgi:S-adenosylmethionine:tRNA-ribosyltransferase-isomerase (queuine synthetase)